MTDDTTVDEDRIPSAVDDGADPTPAPDAPSDVPADGEPTDSTDAPSETPLDAEDAPAQSDDAADVGDVSAGTSPDDVGTQEHAEAAEVAGDVDGGVGELGGFDGEGEVGQTEIAVEPEEVVDDETMRRAVEAILMVSDEPLPAMTLARAVGRATNDVSAALEALAAEYTDQGRGFDLREVAGGWRYYTREEAAQYVERFVLDGQQARLTQAALETLSVVAYKQPVSRARVSAIRGVNVDGVMRTLVTRGLVEEAGTDTESQATLYRTTSYFLERMGMQGLDDLPELAPYLPDMDDIEEELAARQPDVPTQDSTDQADPDGRSALDDQAGPDALSAPDDEAESYERGGPDEHAGFDERAGSGEPDGPGGAVESGGAGDGEGEAWPGHG